ncbi:MAG: phosphate ABC transporter permease PstA [Chloroflexota bacterium]|nr:phosphate ABC transporter permease PstA [Dehalococcoidia bacterium]MDW8254581.1 phosphate ABC transporter permease PstA [Chloroflexota bacterium]
MVVGQLPAETVKEFSVDLPRRKAIGWFFIGLGFLSISFGLFMLLLLLFDVFSRGLPYLTWDFLTSFDSRFPQRAGILAALAGTVYMMGFTIIAALPLGVAAAIYLEEYAGDSWFARLVEINISNLASVPSIIYGLLGLQLFVRAMGLNRSVLAGALTMALVILPIIIVASREALRAVPPSIRDASLALGATKWQTIRHHVLPYALSGIMTGNILAAARAIGESAPLIAIGALTFVPFTPNSPLDLFTVLPIQIFNWTSRPQEAFHDVAAAGIIVLLTVLLVLNSLAIFLRWRFRTQF